MKLAIQAVLSVWLFVGGTSAWADEDPYLKIIWKSPVGDRLSYDEEEQRRKACQTLFDHWRPTKGPWGLGMFASYGCFLDQKHLSGSKRRRANWVLTLAHYPRQLLIRLKSRTRFVVGRRLSVAVAIPRDLRNPEFLTIPSFARLVVARLMVKASVFGQIRNRRFQTVKLSSPGGPWPLPDPPDALDLVRAGPGLIPKPAGIAQFRRKRDLENRIWNRGWEVRADRKIPADERLFLILRSPDTNLEDRLKGLLAEAHKSLVRTSDRVEEEVPPIAKNLNIIWRSPDPSSQSVEAQQLRRQGLDFCASLGRHFVVGQGPWGFGLFDSFSCQIDGRHRHGPFEDPLWRLDIVAGVKSLQFELSTTHRFMDREAPASRLEVDFDKRFAEFCNEPDYGRLVAARLLVASGWLAKVAPVTVGSQPAETPAEDDRQPALLVVDRDERLWSLPKPPSELHGFSFEWVHDASGFRQRKTQDLDLTEVDDDVPWRAVIAVPEGNESERGYPMEPTTSPASTTEEPEPAQFMMVRRGKRELVAAIDDELKKAFDDFKTVPKSEENRFESQSLEVLESTFTSELRSSRLELHYHRSSNPKPFLWKDLQRWAVSFQPRSWIPGLRLRTELYNETIATNEKGLFHYSMSNLQAGWSFGLEAEEVVRLHFTPKVMLWRFRARLPSQNEDELGDPMEYQGLKRIAASLSCGFAIKAWIFEWRGQAEQYQTTRLGIVGHDPDQLVGQRLSGQWVVDLPFLYFGLHEIGTSLVFGYEEERLLFTRSTEAGDLLELIPDDTSVALNLQRAGVGFQLWW